MLYGFGGSPGPTGPMGPPGPQGVPGPGSTFVFRPGAVGPLPSNVFATQAPLDAAIAATQGPLVVECDDSIVSPVAFVAPVTPWRPAYTNNITLTGLSDQNFGGSGPEQAITIAAPLPGVCALSKLNATYSGVVAFRTIASNDLAFFFFDNCLILGGALGAPWFDSTASSALFNPRLQNTEVLSGAILVTASVATGVNGVLLTLRTTSLDGNNLGGPASSFQINEDPASNVGAQPAVTGGSPTFVLFSAALINPNLNGTTMQQAAQAAANTGDLYGTTGTGFTYTSKTGKVRVNFSACGGLSAAGANVAFDIDMNSGFASASFQAGPSTSVAPSSLVNASGEVLASGLPVGTAFPIRVTWAASGASTFAPTTQGTVVVEDVL